MQLLETSEHHVLVLKPAGVACELPFNPEADSVLRRLAAQGLDGVRLVHRLDAPTSGLLLCARTADAAAYYSQEIANRRWHKWYVARVDASYEHVARLRGVHKAYLRTEGRRARVVRSGGKPSSLEIMDGATAPSGRGTDILLRMHTGRYHQIRVMLADLGVPLSGDDKYGGAGPGPILLEHVMLAARPYQSTDWRVWMTPEHGDRAPWAPVLSQVLTQHREALIRSLETPVP